MARFTLPRDLYHGKGALETLKTLQGEKAMVVVGGGSMKRFGFLDRVIAYLEEAGMEVQLFEGIRKNSQSDGIAPYADLVDHYQVVSKTFTYSKNSTYSATSEATLWLRGKGSYFQIQGVVGSATRIQTGTSTASWVQLYNNYNASFPSLSVDFVGSGHFTESRTHSGGGSVNINGFNLTGSTAYTDTYSSDTMSLIWTYKLYA